MSALLDPPTATTVPQQTGPIPLRTRLRPVARRYRRSAVLLLPLLVVTAAARWWNMAGAPQRIDDEGTYTAQAWAVERLGQLGHYTYWYDHPPLGWIQIAGWTTVTRGFERYDVGVVAVREFMVVAAVVSAALLWLLARRLGLSRPAAAGAVLLFALAPIAVQYTRTVYLDNVATPWMLAAFVLALSRRHLLGAFAGAAVCFVIAVLSKETYLLLLPFLVWQLWRSSTPSTRRYTLSVSAALFVLLGSVYVALALLKGELFPGSGRVSLWQGITFQLVQRQGSGNVFDASTQAGLVVRNWLHLGGALLVGGLVAAAVALGVRRLRPLAAAYLVLSLLVLKPGYLPVPYVIVLLPLAAVLVAGVLDAGLRQAASRHGHVVRRSVVSGVAALGVVAVVVSAAFSWPAPLRQGWTSNLDHNLRQAETWLAANTGPRQKVLVDDASWLQLVRAGLPRQNVVWNYKADTDPAVSRLTPHGWTDYTYAEVTQGVRDSVGTSPTLDQALASSIPVASFGDGGPTTVQVVKILPAGKQEFYAAEDNDRRARIAAGVDLLDNTGLLLSDSAQRALRTGRVDSRIVLLLGQLSAEHAIHVAGFPVVPGEGTGPLPARAVRINQVDGESVGSLGGRSVAASIRTQTAPFRPASVRVIGDQLVVRYAVALPEYLLPTPPD